MDKVLVVKKTDGTLKIVHQAPNSKMKISDEIERYVEEGESGRLTDLSSLPADRYFRNAWRDDQPGEQVDIDIEEAKKVQIGKLRIDRAEKFVGLDRDIMIAMEMGKSEETKTLAQEKQRLRDMPILAKKTMETMLDLEEIKNLSLKSLGL